ncbi:MAG: PIN domain-containing protein [Polyangiales bacterium]
MKLALDTSVLGALCHPRKHADVKLWFRGVRGVQGATVYLPEVADFELRRELLRIPSPASLRALDSLPAEIDYLPITTEIMRSAAAMWAALWNTGRPLGTADSLGADVILAAQARAVGATVVTENVAHIGRMVDAVTWRDVT